MASPISLVHSVPDENQKKIIEKYYSGEMIPAEKKPYLTDLRHGVGPYLPTLNHKFILDGSSQIATMGLGFNPTAFFGVGHFYEAWINDPSSRDFQLLKKNYREFLGRKVSWPEASVHFCHSGAEANEIALGQCFMNRKSIRQRRVLAFEGSFHGRMLVTLSATYNPAKREPYEWPGLKADYVDWPQLKFDHKTEGPYPAGWKELWENPESPDFQEKSKNLSSQSETLREEIRSLTSLRDQLRTGTHYALILEPRQCEGGDRYGSVRFHNAVGILCTVYGVPYIYDEVQCGYGLSGEFFWHQLFKNSDSQGRDCGPSYVTCAKKAQLGVVISRRAIDLPEEFAVHSLVRGYIQGMVMDQNREKILAMENKVRPMLSSFVSEFSADLEHPRMQGLSFSIDFKQKELCDKFIAKRFENGLLFYPAGNQTARFRLNLGFSEQDVLLLFDEMKNTLRQAKGQAIEFIKEGPHYDFKDQEVWDLHLNEILNLGGVSSVVPRTETELLSALREMLPVKSLGLQPLMISSKNLKDFESQIASLEASTYEETRITPIEDFRKALNSLGGFAIALLKGEELVAITCLGALDAFPEVRGVRKDGFWGEKGVFYALDLTVRKDFQGQNLGRSLKMASVWAVKIRGGQRIQGRNRDSLAAAMLNINLSLGSYGAQHLSEDYPDNEKYRDCFYYTTRVKWEKPRIRLSEGVQAPLSVKDLSREFMESALPPLFTKICLSNFVSQKYLENLKQFSNLLPENLRHSYTTSGQSECVDKLIKSIWTKRKHERLLTFRNQYFGVGSNASRALSGWGETVFSVDHLMDPFQSNPDGLIEALKKTLAENTYHSLWIEPVSQRTSGAWNRDLLNRVLQLAKTHSVPVVFNDTASMFYRWSDEHFLASADCGPDAGFSYLGGQMGITYSKSEFFVSKPLEIISTWDGDEFSLAQFSEALNLVQADRKEFFEMRSRFHEKLKVYIQSQGGRMVFAEKGRGQIQGALSARGRELLGKSSLCDWNLWTVIPSPGEMRRFVESSL